jgi:hypothetical protein
LPFCSRLVPSGARAAFCCGCTWNIFGVVLRRGWAGPVGAHGVSLVRCSTGSVRGPASWSCAAVQLRGAQGTSMHAITVDCARHDRDEMPARGQWEARRDQPGRFICRCESCIERVSYMRSMYRYASDEPYPLPLWPTSVVLDASAILAASRMGHSTDRRGSASRDIRTGAATRLATATITPPLFCCLLYRTERLFAPCAVAIIAFSVSSRTSLRVPAYPRQSLKRPCHAVNPSSHAKQMLKNSADPVAHGPC